MSTAQPLLRFPVFLMGVLGGIQTLRYYARKDSTDLNLHRNLFHTILPWGGSYDIFVSQKSNTEDNIKQESPTVIWRRRVDFSACFSLIALSFLIIFRMLLEIYYSESKIVKWILHTAMDQGLDNYVIQFLLVHLQLTLIIGLCMDNGNSRTSVFLRSKVPQFLGRISVSLYLTHWPMIGYISLAINGQDKCLNENSVRAFTGWSSCAVLPQWSPILTMIVSPLIAFIVTKYFEEPISAILRQ